jgi:hypothetical protein
VADDGDASEAASAGGEPTATVILALYQKMLTYLFMSAASIVVILLILILLPYLLYGNPADQSHHGGQSTEAPDSVFLVVVLAGTLGAFFSALIRLYDFKDLPKALYQTEFVKARIALFIYSLVPALVGGIAAAVMYMIFAGHLLQGSFFPDIECRRWTGCGTFSLVINSYGPKEAVDFAKIIFWGFVAGFAERLVPDLLNNFAQSQAIVDAGKEQAVNPKATARKGDGESAELVAPAMASRGQANKD